LQILHLFNQTPRNLTFYIQQPFKYSLIRSQYQVQSQKVIARSTLSVWHATCTELSLDCIKAVGQVALVQSAPVPSHPLKYPNPEVTENAWGGINDISVLDPLPGLVGLIKVVSMRVQLSPLNPQPPVCKYAMAAVRGPLDTKSAPVDNTLGPWIRVGVPKPQLLTKWTVCVSALTNVMASRVTQKDLKRNILKAHFASLAGPGPPAHVWARQTGLWLSAPCSPARPPRHPPSSG